MHQKLAVDTWKDTSQKNFIKKWQFQIEGEKMAIPTEIK